MIVSNQNFNALNICKTAVFPTIIQRKFQQQEASLISRSFQSLQKEKKKRSDQFLTLTCHSLPASTVERYSEYLGTEPTPSFLPSLIICHGLVSFGPSVCSFWRSTYWVMKHSVKETNWCFHCVVTALLSVHHWGLSTVCFEDFHFPLCNHIKKKVPEKSHAPQVTQAILM